MGEGGAQDALQPPGSVSWWRLVGGAALAGNMMALSLAANVSEAPVATRFALHLTLLLMTFVVALLLAAPLITQLRMLWASKTMDIEVMFTLAALGALAFSLHSTFVSGGDVYYELVSILLAIYGLSQRLKMRTQAGVEGLLTQALLIDATAVVIGANGTVKSVAVGALRTGDLVRVHPGQPIPIDGTVEQGQGTVQTLALSGEPFGEEVRPGGKVLATWTALDATLLIRADCDGDARYVDRLGARVRRHLAMQEPVSARRNKASTQLLIERLVRWFAPFVMMTASVTVLFWWRAGPAQALLSGLAVLLVACPCALGFAVPLGLRLGVFRLARAGIRVRSLDAIERMANIRRIAFDKTGTLTKISVQAQDIYLLQPAHEATAEVPQALQPHDGTLTGQQLFALAQAAQRLSDHPIAMAFGASAQLAPSPWQVTATRVVAGRGIEAACVDTSGRPRLLVLGEPTKLVPSHQRAQAAALALQLPKTAKPIAMCIDDSLVALVALHERPLTDVRQVLASFAEMQVQAEVLSGDNHRQVQALGVASAYGGLSAEQKAERMAAQQQQGLWTCFVGDGFNDTAAMSEARVCVAMADGSALARGLADFIIPAGHPEAALQALVDCRKTFRAVRANVAIALGYNTLGIALAACGLINPVAAALLMLASSLTVSGLTLWVHHASQRGRAWQPALV